MRYRYRYRSADNRYYILVLYHTGIDGVSYVKWSMYRYGYDYGEENITTLDKDFDEMVNSEEWERADYEVVPCQ
jgi:hypothetical protein